MPMSRLSVGLQSVAPAHLQTASAHLVALLQLYPLTRLAHRPMCLAHLLLQSCQTRVVLSVLLGGYAPVLNGGGELLLPISGWPAMSRVDAPCCRFSGNPLVVGDPLLRFYAGAPLVSSSGHRLGAL